jgi:hypothetical protein
MTMIYHMLPKTSKHTNEHYGLESLSGMFLSCSNRSTSFCRGGAGAGLDPVHENGRQAGSPIRIIRAGL